MSLFFFIVSTFGCYLRNLCSPQRRENILLCCILKALLLYFKINNPSEIYFSVWLGSPFHMYGWRCHPFSFHCNGIFIINHNCKCGSVSRFFPSVYLSKLASVTHYKCITSLEICQWKSFHFVLQDRLCYFWSFKCYTVLKCRFYYY